MNQSEINTDKYYEDLNKLLINIRNDIETIVKPPINDYINNWENIDKYIYEINSFYYHSFHSRFMPVYHRKIEQDISHLLHISGRENMIKKDILANIKRYASLYNRIKTTTNLLYNLRTDINTRLLLSVKKQNQESVRLLNILKQFSNNLVTLNKTLLAMVEMLKDEDFLTILESFTLTAPTLRMLADIDKDDLLVTEKFKNFLSKLCILENHLTNLSRETNPAIIEQIIIELQQTNNEISSYNLPAPLKIFYKNNLYQVLDRNIELLKMLMEKGDYPRINHFAEEDAEWLSRLNLFLSKSWSYVIKVNFLYPGDINWLPGLDKELVDELEKRSQQILKSINNQISELSTASQPDFDYFITRLKTLTEEIYPFFYSATTCTAVKNNGLLCSSLNRVCMEIVLLQNELDFLLEKNIHTEEVSGVFLKTLNTLDTYLNLLANNKADLERLLAPRNIARLWKDMNIRVERIPLEKDKIFPADYKYILDKYAVEMRLIPEDDMKIIHEEGDIFIIRVDEWVEEEVPYMVIGTKG